MLMSANGCSIVLMTAQKIIKKGMDTFKIYTERAIENVQDGISRPLCNLEISNLISNPVRHFF